ncbi:hypothetical protein FRUB_09505 [Fimbriiglobus ruber]|uniref:Uncharacterized protein n=1 Tax=Fimbriiglobus ruber TaxID=1908690 RepID=A0A225D6R4_9BACT|nr:hypothetical protein FRUB_09505 [Fimbriiglobus ruber]
MLTGALIGDDDGVVGRVPQKQLQPLIVLAEQKLCPHAV